uniref:Uncharacterized protein n=1 Tax=Guillardia theta TaxID=55529 RepID=A0A6U6BJG1_GUITH|mmetsp:Transcript_38936/g.122776  ORF Transcript_38936/g.122776 Transcript_38936/m.122776 type:complete len:332 (+) Transcript_38936:423-1418(+)
MKEGRSVGGDRLTVPLDFICSLPSPEEQSSGALPRMERETFAFLKQEEAQRGRQRQEHEDAASSHATLDDTLLEQLHGERFSTTRLYSTLSTASCWWKNKPKSSQVHKPTEQLQPRRLAAEVSRRAGWTSGYVSRVLLDEKPAFAGSRRQRLGLHSNSNFDPQCRFTSGTLYSDSSMIPIGQYKLPSVFGPTGRTPAVFSRSKTPQAQLLLPLLASDMPGQRAIRVQDMSMSAPAVLARMCSQSDVPPVFLGTTKTVRNRVEEDEGVRGELAADPKQARGFEQKTRKRSIRRKGGERGMSPEDGAKSPLLPTSWTISDSSRSFPIIPTNHM